MCTDLISHGGIDGGNNCDHIIAKGSLGATGGNIVAGGGYFSAIRRYFGKLMSLFTSRKRISDQEKAVLWMFLFILLTIGVAAFVNMLIR